VVLKDELVIGESDSGNELPAYDTLCFSLPSWTNWFTGSVVQSALFGIIQQETIPGSFYLDQQMNKYGEGFMDNQLCQAM
jgi:hypothetical protein